MNKPTDNLKRDHEYILNLIGVMYRMTRSKTTHITHLQMVVSIIWNFADGLHHAKEENLLFPAMTEKGFPLEGGPVGVMLKEHEQGRIFVKGMAENIEAFKAGNVTALHKVYENMMGYAELLHNHIFKENNILFKMADEAFTNEEQQVLLEKFEKVENEYTAGSLSDFVAAIEELAQAYPEE